MPLRILGETPCEDLRESELPVLQLQLESFLTMRAASPPPAGWCAARPKPASWLWVLSSCRASGTHAASRLGAAMPRLRSGTAPEGHQMVRIAGSHGQASTMARSRRCAEERRRRRTREAAFSGAGPSRSLSDAL